MEALRQILETRQLALATMKMTDHLLRLFEIYSIGSSQCILVVVRMHKYHGLLKEVDIHMNLNPD